MKRDMLPKQGIAGLKNHFKNDLVSGFSVSLIALPLCLGIAIASGVPPLAGLITAIVGGLFGSRISGSFVTISGPAAGLIVIILGAVDSLGGGGVENNFEGYPHALGAIVIAGLIMALFGFFKTGKVGDYFPSATVHGMLSAIGLIILIKQFYPAIGVAAPAGSILEVAAHIPLALRSAHLPSAIIGLVSLAILIVHSRINLPWLKKIPAPMIVLLVSVGLGAWMNDPKVALVELPHQLFGEGGVTFPSFSKITTGPFWTAVIGIALVAALESLLSAKAVDELDPYQRKSNLDKDLVAMGSSSSLAALIGGLPMISEIVRSSANVNNGGKTQWANFFHGLFLLLFLLIASPLIELIPLSALAAMLVFTGFRLSSPKEFKHMLEIGKTEFIIFIITLVAVLATDLIVGIGIGILAKYLLMLVKGVSIVSFFKLNAKSPENSTSLEETVIHLSGPIHFSNYLLLKSRLDNALKDRTSVVLDFNEVSFIDHTVMNHLSVYKKRTELEGKNLHLAHLEHLKSVSNYPTAERHG